jgi:hypothetical protein
MRRLVALIALSFFIFFAKTASAAEGAESGTQTSDPLAGRAYLTATYSITAISGVDGYIVMQPIGGEVGFRPDKRVEVGFSVDYGKSTASLSCKDCEATRWHAIARARVHLVKDARIVDPWLGGGVGYEALSMPKMNGTGIDPISAIDGVIETGLDIHLLGGFKIGPRVAIEYSLRSGDAPTWALYGGDFGPLTYEAGARIGYSF